MSTVAHEIGHVFVGYGHPDHPYHKGDAYLLGIDERRPHLRLMCTGGRSGPQSRLLVKKEWDLAEAWLKPNIDDKQPQ